MQQRVRPARREPIVILPTPVRVTRTAAQRRVPGFVIGRSPSKHSGNGRPPPTAVTMHDSPYDSEEEADAWYAREVAVEYKDFVDEILEESPEAIQMTTDTSLAIGRDSNAISGGGSNANSGGGPGTVEANSRDSNANSGGRSNGSDTQQAIDQDSNANSGGGSNANSGRCVTSQHILYYCMYYSVSLTCTVHCTIDIDTLYVLPCFLVHIYLHFVITCSDLTYTLSCIHIQVIHFVSFTSVN